jgi:hypothetical protein
MKNIAAGEMVAVPLRERQKDNAQLKEPDQIKLTQPRGTTLINLLSQR